MTETDVNNKKNDNIFKNLNKVWQLIGCFTAPILITVLLLQYFTNTFFNMYQWLLWLHLPLIMFHEFEEYILPGGFKDFINNQSVFSLNKPQNNALADESIIFFINPVLIWPWAIIAAVFYTLPWIGFSLIIFQFLINNIQHTMVFQLKNRGYNPGLFTTMFVLIPYCTCMFWYVITSSLFSTLDWVLSFLIGGGLIGILLVRAFLMMKNSKDKKD